MRAQVLLAQDHAYADRHGPRRMAPRISRAAPGSESPPAPGGTPATARMVPLAIAATVVIVRSARAPSSTRTRTGTPRDLRMPGITPRRSESPRDSSSSALARHAFGSGDQRGGDELTLRRRADRRSGISVRREHFANLRERVAAGHRSLLFLRPELNSDHTPNSQSRKSSV